MTQKEPVSKKEYEELENKTKKLRKNLALEIEINDRYRKALEEIEEYIKKYECDNCEEYTFGCGDCGTPRDILDIINKAKGERMSKILNRWWYTTHGGHLIGIVKTVDEITNEVKFRIGCGDGFNELLDEERICMHGDKFYPEVIK